MNSTGNIASTIQLTNELELQCPYSDISDVCGASLSSLLPAPNMRVNFCDTENYDDCPIFLSKVLRRR